MTLWQLWLQRPQSLGLRKAVFQIHLWLGIAIRVVHFRDQRFGQRDPALIDVLTDERAMALATIC